MRTGTTVGISRGRWWLTALGALVAPFLLLTLLVVVTRLVVHTTDWDMLLFYLSIATGSVFLLRLPLYLWVRLLLCLAYVPLCFFALVLYGLFFVCYAFGECV